MDKFMGCVGVVLLAFLIVVIGAGVFIPLATHHEVTLVVRDKERIAGANSGRYLIFAEDKVYENVDSLLNGKWDSSDLYNNIEIGATYQCEAIGWRIPFFSMYENLLDCTLIAPAPEAQ